MIARQLIEKGSFGPNTLSVVFQAFDEAWAEIAANYSPDQVEAARMRLANVLLSVTTEGMTDAATLKRLALQLMAEVLIEGRQQRPGPCSEGEPLSAAIVPLNWQLQCSANSRKFAAVWNTGSASAVVTIKT